MPAGCARAALAIRKGRLWVTAQILAPCRGAARLAKLVTCGNSDCCICCELAAFALFTHQILRLLSRSQKLQYWTDTWGRGEKSGGSYLHDRVTQAEQGVPLQQGQPKRLQLLDLRPAHHGRVEQGSLCIWRKTG